ncbi:MAG: SPFH/Band 7/PHB domain protein [Gammaproteobacteria bacterium]|nr:SPFH/Band 7/PHB domain protein [Gammaproteobacteria bacterium]
MELTFLAIIFVIFVAVTIGTGIRIVPQGSEWVVERLGKYHSTLTPGLHILIPYIDRVAYRVTTKDIILDVPEQEVITKDNAVLMTNAIAFVKVTDTQNAVYGVSDYNQAVTNMVQTSLRSIIGSMMLDEALSSRDKIKAELKSSIADDVADWGLTLKSVEIQDIKPSLTMQQSMEQQAAAERERKAAVTRAEGEKTAAILNAEGKLEAAKREAEAQIALAKSSATAIGMVTAAIADNTVPAYFLLGEKYIAALKEVATKQGNTTIVLPADLIQSVQSLIGRKGVN